MKKIAVLMLAMFVLSLATVANAQELRQWTNPNYQMLYRDDPPPGGPPPQDPPPKYKKPKHKKPPARKPAPPPEPQPEPQPPHKPAPRW
ncbi:hypothetical protein [Sporomusa aerivorans]|uniref:hypothetical protein n=1 Tax=Sporomusa aerivorans TaxID=204936 RepID=UPI00352B1612